MKSIFATGSFINRYFSSLWKLPLSCVLWVIFGGMLFTYTSLDNSDLAHVTYLVIIAFFLVFFIFPVKIGVIFETQHGMRR